LRATVIASEAKQSSLARCAQERLDCFVAALLAMTWKLHCLSLNVIPGDATASNFRCAISHRGISNFRFIAGRCAGMKERVPSSLISNFFTAFVDGMFTTFIAPPFTNNFEANAQKHAMHCV
jgi:hypothetical protein